VGGNEQVKAMKKVAGPLRTDQAEYKDLEAFAKFGSDLDPATQNVIDKGRRNVELLKQGKNTPLSVEEEIAVIYAGTQNLLRTVPVQKVKEWEEKYLTELTTSHKAVMADLHKGVLNPEIEETLKTVAAQVSADM
jgi:F-type H+-transporting ATPase subunit alpha